MAERQALQRLLLALLAPRQQVSEVALAGLTAPDWDQLLEMVRQHRVGPLLNAFLRQRQPGLPFPAQFMDALRGDAKRAALRALTLQRELILIHRLLTKADIPYQVMKGPFLALHAYPQAGLRPMRDLDILVPRAEALRAYQILIDGGLVRPEKYPGNPEAQILTHRHLPPLISPLSGVVVELHARLQQTMEDASSVGQGLDPSDDPDYWTRGIRRPTAGYPLCYPNPTDLLLNLIVHAALEHNFNNGPLTLSDIGYLLAVESIDWPTFWRRAEQGGWSRACWLTLRLVERYWGNQQITWPTPGFDSPEARSALDNAALLMVADLGAKGGVWFFHALHQQQSLQGKVGTLLRRLFPTRLQIASSYSVSARSPRVYQYYLHHLVELLYRRLPRILRTHRKTSAQGMVTQLAQLERWLNP